MSIGDFPEILSQRILVGIIFVQRLGVEVSWGCEGVWDVRAPTRAHSSSTRGLMEFCALPRMSTVAYIRKTPKTNK